MSLILTYLIRSLMWHIPGMRLLATFGVVLAAGGIALYILYAMALGRIAVNRHIRWPWLSWVPVANMYVLGACADDERGRGLYAFLCPALLGAAMICWLITVAGGDGDVLAAGPWLTALAFALGAAAAVLAFVALSWVYRSTSKAPTALLVLSILFFLLIPIFLYALRNRLPGGGRALKGSAQGD